MGSASALGDIVNKYQSEAIHKSIVLYGECIEIISRLPENSIHAVVTDPPFGLEEFKKSSISKRKSGKGGVWRIPPSFDGSKRAPLPRFTALNQKQKNDLKHFFVTWAKALIRVLLPGANVIIASNSLLSQILFQALVEGGLEFRGQVIRLVRTFRGGDRPKNAEQEFSDVCTMPRSCHEPWGLFRKKIPSNMRISDCLKAYQTGGLRRKDDGNPFEDIIGSERTSQKDKKIIDHPSLKPIPFMMKIVYASLPLGKGVILDPFMGGGTTIIAANNLDYNSIGIEFNEDFYQDAINGIKFRVNDFKNFTEFTHNQNTLF